MEIKLLPRVALGRNEFTYPENSHHKCFISVFCSKVFPEDQFPSSLGRLTMYSWRENETVCAWSQRRARTLPEMTLAGQGKLLQTLECVMFQ